MGKKKGFNTRALHTPYPVADAHGSLRMPLYDTVAYEFGDARLLQETFSGGKPGHVYSRSSNPTVEYLERIVQNLTGGPGVIALSSGMAAISNLVLALVRSGDNVITSPRIFGNTYSLFSKTLKSLGIEFRFTDLRDPANVTRLADGRSRAVFLETVSNPTLEVADVRSLAEVTHGKGLVLIADTTTSPLCFCDYGALGVDVEVISGTKFISGGATSVGGFIIDRGNFDWSSVPALEEAYRDFSEMALICKLRKEIYRNMGSCLAPANAYFQTLGLETLSLRVERSCDNALAIAQELERNPKVRKVYYPGLTASPYHEIAKKQFGSLFGAIVTFSLSSKESCFRFLDALEVIRRATNLNDNKSLAIHPASTIYCEFGEKELRDMGVDDTMVRLAVGIEDCPDLLGDIRQALDGV